MAVNGHKAPRVHICAFMVFLADISYRLQWHLVGSLEYPDEYGMTRGFAVCRQ